MVHYLSGLSMSHREGQHIFSDPPPKYVEESKVQKAGKKAPNRYALLFGLHEEYDGNVRETFFLPNRGPGQAIKIAFLSVFAFCIYIVVTGFVHLFCLG